MTGRKRRIALAAIAAIVLIALAVRHPSADITILTHQSDDLAPARLQAAIDTGLFAVSLLVTWSRHFSR